MSSDAQDPVPGLGPRIVRDVCWLGERHPQFRDDYPLSFPPESDAPESNEAEEPPEPPASLRSGNGAD